MKEKLYELRFAFLGWSGSFVVTALAPIKHTVGYWFGELSIPLVFVLVAFLLYKFAPQK